MEAQDSKSRFDEIDETMKINKINADIQTLWNILTHASEGLESKGWGKLLGYFDTKNNNLCIKESYPLILNKGEKIKRDGLIENELSKMNSENRYVYRQIGFYIISSDYEYFKNQILNYLINNENIKTPNVFLYFDVNKAKRNEKPWSFFEPSEEFNKICKVHRYNEKVLYEIVSEKFDEFVANGSEFFRNIDYIINRTPAFDLLVVRNNKLFEKIFDEDLKLENELYIDEMISGINELVLSKNAILSSKKKNISNKINFNGSLRRNKKLISQKKEILDELKEVIEKYSKKCSN